MHLPRLIATLSLCLLSVAGSADAQVITDVSPDTGTFGTEVTITGTGFGSAKLKVSLMDPVTGKQAAKLKVLSRSPTEIVGRIGNARVGTFDLAIRGKGMPTVILPSSVTIAPPDPRGRSAGMAKIGEPVTLVGEYFGPKKKKVFVGGFKAKVTSWKPETITFKAPKKAAGKGPLDVTVRNAVGEGTLRMALTVLPKDRGDPPIGKNTVLADISGLAYSASKSKLPKETVEGLYVDPGFGILPYAIIGSFESVTQSATRSLTITIPVDPYAVSLPVVITSATYSGQIDVESLLRYSENDNLSGHDWELAPQGWTITLDSRNGKLIAGTFEGTLVPQDDGQPVLQVTGGQYRVVLKKAAGGP